MSPLAGEILVLESRLLMAVTIELRYDFDANNFFDTQAKRDLMQQAANSIADRLSDSLSPIVASGTNVWSADFYDPATGAMRSVNNLVVPANTLEVFVGGRPLNGAERGFGGPGGFSWSGSTDWGNVVEGRGQAGALAPVPTDNSPWGGAISFDTRTNWYFGTTTAGLLPSQTDFLSVAEHEIGHILGIGNIQSDGGMTSWSRYIVGNTFFGPTAMAAHSALPVPIAVGGNHWASGTGSAGQEAAMTPILTDGTRKLFSPLDFAGLVDVGWTLQPSSAIGFSMSTYAVSEGAGTAAVTINRSNATGFAIVHFATYDGTATAGLDYTPFSVDLMFGPGESSKTLRIPILNDARAESNETVILTLSNGVNTSPGAITQAVLTILDNDRGRNGMSDFDGDGLTDLAVFRPSQAAWLSNESGGGTLNTSLGEPNLVDIPAPGDYDGDGKTDLIVFRPSDALWIGRLSGGGVLNTHFGYPGLFDVPAPGDYDGDGTTDLAVYRPSQSRWIAQLSGGGTMIKLLGMPDLFDVPAPGDYDGDGTTDLAVYRPSQSRWIAQLSGGGTLNQLYGAPNLVDVPTQASFGSLLALGVLTPAVSASSRAVPAALANSGGGFQSATGYADVSVPLPDEVTANVAWIRHPRSTAIAKQYQLD